MAVKLAKRGRWFFINFPCVIALFNFLFYAVCALYKLITYKKSETVLFEHWVLLSMVLWFLIGLVIGLIVPQKDYNQMSVMDDRQPIFVGRGAIFAYLMHNQLKPMRRLAPIPKCGAVRCGLITTYVSIIFFNTIIVFTNSYELVLQKEYWHMFVLFFDMFVFTLFYLIYLVLINDRIAKLMGWR